MTESLAKKYFGDEEPMGKTLYHYAGLDQPVQVTGIIKDIPDNSSLYFDYLGSFDVCRKWKEPDSWTSSQDFKIFVLLNESIDFQEADQILSKFSEENFADYNIRFFLQPLTKMHLYSNFKFDVGHGSIQHVMIFALIAIIILLIASINYMNLSTAKYSRRLKDIGSRKVAGASRIQIIMQFLNESILYCFIAFPLSLILVELFLPSFRILTEKNLLIDYFDINFLIYSFFFILIVGVLSGSYPAFLLSSFKPVTIFKGITASGAKKLDYRKLMVTIQFAFTVIAIIGTLVVSSQLKFLEGKDLGYQKENLIYLRTPNYFAHKYESIKADLLKNSSIKSATVSNDLPIYVNLNTGAEWEGKPADAKYIGFQTIAVDEDFLTTYQMELAQGRFYSKDFPADIDNAFVINEAAVRAMGLEEPLGKRLKAWGKDGKIIGVLKDFNFKSLHEGIEPLILHLGRKYSYRYLSLRIESRNVSGTIQYVENIWKSHSPQSVYEIHFFDEKLDALYTSDKRLGEIFTYFAFLAIFISCLGLIGLVSYSVDQKTKEIGIRKVLGASVPAIVSMLTKDYMKWIVVANIIAWPVAWYFMQQWLENFAYRTDIGFWIFVVAGISVLGMALITVSWQAIRAALSNPVDSLRYE
jgi:putative ABC transport system permease protein